MDRHLIFGALALLILEITILAGDPSWLSHTHSKEKNTKPALGRVIHVKEKVRKKNQDSIAWQNSHNNENLLAYDSLLTLKGSSAKIELINDVQITLHENTLIVIEPIEDKSETSKMHFNKGFLESKIRQKNLKLGTDDWTIAAEPGTDLSIKSLENNQLEIEVNRGRLEISNKNTSLKKIINTQSVITTTSTEVKRVQSISSQMKWDKIKDRVYSHQFPFEYQLSWQGEVTQVEIYNQNKKEIIPIAGGNAQHKIRLNPGTYSFRLINSQQEMSEQKTLELLKAPLVYYYSPLPRERIITNSKPNFFWSPLMNSNQFLLEISPDIHFSNLFIQTTSSTHFSSVLLNKSEHLFWRIRSLDRDGYVIPESFVYELFTTDSPFSAPKIKKIEVRQPASDSPEKSEAKNPNTDNPNTDNPESSDHSDNSRKENITLINRIFQIFIPQAYAKSDKMNSLKELILEWEDIPGADFYIIEISSEPNFINPEIIKKVETNSFKWLESFQHAIYYLRVAAGSSGGKLGLFSPPQVIDINKITKQDPTAQPKLIQKSNSNSKVSNERMQNFPEINSHIESIDRTKTLPIEPKPIFLSKHSILEPIYLFSTSFGYNIYKRKFLNKPDFEVHQKNSSLPYLNANIRMEKLILNADIFIHHLKSNTMEQPFQENLSYTNFQLSWLYRISSIHSFGLIADREHLLERKSFEQLKLNPTHFYGLAYRILFRQKNWETQFNFKIATNNNQLTHYSTFIKVQSSETLNRWGVFAGGHYYLDLMEGEKLKSQAETTGLHLGIQW